MCADAGVVAGFEVEHTSHSANYLSAGWAIIRCTFIFVNRDPPEDDLEHRASHTAVTGQAPIAWTTIPASPVSSGGPANAYEPVPIANGASDGIKWFEHSAARFPDRIAVTDDRTGLSYGELLDRVYGLAARIAEAVPRGAAVVSLLHNGPAAAVAMLAALCCGRTIIPVDAGHPAERQAAIFSVAGTQVVILAEGQEVDEAVLPASVVPIRFDVTRPTGAKRPADVASDPSVPTLVLFTSGSTGNPKGVAHLVRPASVAWFVDKFHLYDDDVFICIASMSQTGVADLMCLAAGATLHIVDVQRRGLSDVLTVMRSAGVTFLSFVPSAIRMILAVAGIEQVLARLRVLDLHGERILASDIALLRTKLSPDCLICVTYGATEVGTVFSWFVRDEALDTELVPIGYLCPDKAFALIGEDGGSVPHGEIGELLVRGPLALGDWFHGKLVAERFPPAADGPNGSIYATGDLVRLRPDGLATFVGRGDRRVKIRGLWVDLGEVEAAIRSCGDVADAVVLVHEAAGEPDEVAAFVVPADAALPPTKSVLRDIVSAATADHMAPRRIQFISAIPRLPNYKPDIVRLRSAG